MVSANSAIVSGNGGIAWPDRRGRHQRLSTDVLPKGTRRQRQQQAPCSRPPKVPQPEAPSPEQTRPCSAQRPLCWADVPLELEGPFVGTGPTASARRRLRRKRLTQRTQEARPEPGAGNGSESHFLCTRLTEDLEAGGEARAAALVRLRGLVARLALEREGCRVVQRALELAEQPGTAQLLEGLRGQVHTALCSPHGNHVLQTIVTALPTHLSGFVAQELVGSGAAVARHRFGCRVLCRLIEFSGTSAELQGLLREILTEAGDLCRHTYGHYVMQSALEHLPEHRPQIAEALRTDLAGNACNRSASHVLEVAFEYCDAGVQQGLALEIGSNHQCVVDMAKNQFGWFVLKMVLRLPGRGSEAAWGHLRRALPCVEGTKYGRRLLHELGVSAVAEATGGDDPPPE